MSPKDRLMKVKPKPGLKVLRPEELRPLNPEGEDVPRTSYWLRRLAAGEVVLCKGDK